MKHRMEASASFPRHGTKGRCWWHSRACAAAHLVAGAAEVMSGRGKSPQPGSLRAEERRGRWDTQPEEGWAPGLQKEPSPRGTRVTACSPSTLREKPSSGQEWHCAPLGHQHQPFPCGPQARGAPRPSRKAGEGAEGVVGFLVGPRHSGGNRLAAMGQGWTASRGDVPCPSPRADGSFRRMPVTLAEGVLVLSGSPLGKFLSPEALPPSSWAAGGRGTRFWPTFPVVTPLAHAVPSVESRGLCAHGGFDNSLLFFFFGVIAES